MKRVSRVVTCSVMSVLLIGGVASAATTGTITNTGPDSVNRITINNDCTTTVTNQSTVDVSNSSQQSSQSGSATSAGNTTAGGASSGNAGNSGSFGLNLSIDNSAPQGCDIQQTTTPGGGSGGGQVSGVSTTAVGGRGAGQVSGVAQVQAPVGGVGAGAGGLSASIFAASILSGTLGVYRLHRARSLKT